MRKERYNFNFFENNTILKSMCNYFELDELKVRDYLCELNECDFLEFIKTFRVNLFKYDSSKTFIRCRHMTTSNEKLKSFKEYGLLNLKEALTFETPLKSFLKQNDVEFNIESKCLFYKGKRYELFWHNDECKKCNYGKCRYLKDILNDKTTLTYRDMSCNYRKAITQLYGKLYKDRAETEVFLSGDYKEIYNYSVISRCPEILYTIDDSIKKVFCENSNLQNKWRNINNQAYILEFYTSIQNFELIGTNILYEGDSFTYEIIDYYSEVDKIDGNENFYRNMFLLINSIHSYYGYPREFGQLYPETKIPFDTLDIYRIRNNFDKIEVVEEDFFDV